MNQKLKEEYYSLADFDELEIDSTQDSCNEGLRDDLSDETPIFFSAGKRRNDWQIFTSHGLVLISILNSPGRTIREIALELNLTDRSIALALADLVEHGFLVRERVGRRTFYHVNEDQPLRYPVSSFGVEEKIHLTVRALRAENLATHASKDAGYTDQATG